MRRVRCLSAAAGMCILARLAALSLAAEPVADWFHKPVRLQTDGQDIDTGAVWGHSGPCLHDLDGDGLRDLIVGDFGGKFRVYRNVGARGKPQFAKPYNLMAGGGLAEVRIYCCMGSNPCFADFDGDGQADLLSGSYDPGACYWFRGLGKGEFAARQTIVDASGKPVLQVPDQAESWHSFGSWPAMVDWDADGDLDLLVGTFDGTAFVRLNEGTRTAPVFSANNLEVQAAGSPLQLPGTRHAALVVADWDGDGRWDLVSGADNGAVYFFRNSGSAGQPAFEAPQMLVPAHKGGRGYEELREAGDEPMPGIRTQIAVVDFDDDGKLDLLTGDFRTTLTVKAGLSAADREAMRAAMKQLQTASTATQELIGKLKDEFVKRYPGDAIGSKEANEEFAKAYAALIKTDKYQKLAAEEQRVRELLHKYLEKPANRDVINSLASCHGYVWLYRHK